MYCVTNDGGVLYIMHYYTHKQHTLYMCLCVCYTLMYSMHYYMSILLFCLHVFPWKLFYRRKQN